MCILSGPTIDLDNADNFENTGRHVDYMPASPPAGPVPSDNFLIHQNKEILFSLDGPKGSFYMESLSNYCWRESCVGHQRRKLLGLL